MFHMGGGKFLAFSRVQKPIGRNARTTTSPKSPNAKTTNKPNRYNVGSENPYRIAFVF